MKLRIPHPFLFAAYFVIFLLSNNIGELPVDVILRPLIAVTIITFIVLSLLRIFLKDQAKREIIASIFITSFFSYGHVMDSIKKFMRFYSPSNNILNHVSLVPSGYRFTFFALIFLSFMLWTVKSKRDFVVYSEYLSVFAVILLIFPILNIAIFEVTERRSINLPVGVYSNSNATPLLAEASVRPDIYYFILDAYGRSDVLERVYGYNTPFIEYLTKKGFYVANDSRSNYARTSFSLASSLNMRYLDELKNVPDPKNYIPLTNMIKDNEITFFLKRHGYTNVYLASAPLIQSGKNIDMKINHEKYYHGEIDGRLYQKAFIQKKYVVAPVWQMSYFEIMLIEKTPLRILSSYEPLDPYLAHRNKILFYLGQVSRLPEIKEPTFVLVYLLCPHPPFVFGPNGELVKNTREYSEGDADDFPGTREEYIEGYRNQLNYMNILLEKTIDTIIANSETPPVIILQGDHGPVSGLTLRDINDVDLEERMSILNAYYLPYSGNQRLYSSITPVNSFRVIFKYYFNASYEPLEDISYFSPLDNPYDFIEEQFNFTRV